MNIYNPNSEQARQGEAAENALIEEFKKLNLNARKVWDIMKEEEVPENRMAIEAKSRGDIEVDIPGYSNKCVIEVKSAKVCKSNFLVCESSRTSFFGNNKFYCLVLLDELYSNQFCFLKSATLHKYLSYKELKERDDGWKHRMLPTNMVCEKRFNLGMYSAKDFVDSLKK